ncbi:MAG TPA: V-type ATP synthase subunit K [Candidatus Bathyarchaeia archaeon]|nr:V-type ATP synthase subunit K [Candidatus Bathyarchaeia archaeon]
METEMLLQFKDLALGAVLGLSALGSAIGIGYSGQAAVGAWKKGFVRNKPVSMASLLVCISAPITQTFYGMILMTQMQPLVEKGILVWFLAIFSGTAICMSAVSQGKIGAAAADALGESEKGFGNYLIALGIVESVAIFVMVFTLIVLRKLGA